MSTSDEAEKLAKKINKAAKIILSAGMMPFPPTDTFIEILKFYLDEEDMDFIKAFKTKKSMTMEQLQKKLPDLSEDEIDKKAAKLAKKGFIFNQPSSSGLMVYRLLPIVAIGAFEYTYMPELPKDEKELEKLRKLAKLYDTLMLELASAIQERYDSILPMFKQAPPIDRTIPIYTNEEGKTIEINKSMQAEEQVLPAQSVEEIIKKFDTIAVGNCFCRQYREMLEEPCKIDAPMEVCFTFGKSAKHVIQQGFARKVSKEEALEILKKTDEAGLVHKAFHNKSDIYKIENSICNCCKCCCDTFNLWRMGATAMINSTNYLSQVNKDTCTGCGTCEEKCPTGAISVGSDNLANVNEELCIGCGICAHFCPEGAISLKEGLRKVFVPPPRIKK
ncbi:MAG: 4Fe-4S binding protein [Candidatus Helarchaeota archaeon]|nr:4Fe-4S binding protein [Candidatus Helarchaeota archaeon]